MCWKYFRQKRNWALWLSGFFAMGALSNLIFGLLNIEVTVFGITVTQQLALIRFAVYAVLSYLFLWYWSKAQARRKSK